MASTAVLDTITTTANTDNDNVESTELNSIDLVNMLVTRIESLSSEISEMKKLSKIALRSVSKMSRRKIKRTSDGVSKPSGFTLPVRILPKLTMFLNDIRSSNGEATRSAGECMPRTDVTRYITNYIKCNNLQDPGEKRVIVLDAKLATLFDGNVGDRITWFKLQSTLAPLYDRSPEAQEENKRQKMIAANADNENVATETATEEPAAAASAKKKAKVSKTVSDSADDSSTTTSTVAKRTKKAAAAKAAN